MERLTLNGQEGDRGASVGAVLAPTLLQRFFDFKCAAFLRAPTLRTKEVAAVWEWRSLRRAGAKLEGCESRKSMWQRQNLGCFPSVAALVG